jgi:hypothetical protein
MMQFKYRCYRGGKLHNYVARYTEKGRTLEVQSCNYSPIEMRSLLTLQVYVGDICTWCGTTVRMATKETSEAADKAGQG